MDYKKIAEDNLIFQCIVGSELYGTNGPDSDRDINGIFVPPPNCVYGLQNCDQVMLNNEGFQGKNLTKVKIDSTIYSLIKFIKLAINNNPNILSLLYIPVHCTLVEDNLFNLLKKNRHLFLSKKAYHSFRGYAHAQKRKLLTKEAIGKRKERVEKHGYDTKFAQHLIRLLYEALDIFTIGELIYPSPHAKLLSDIKNGKYNLDWVLTEAIRLENLVDMAYVNSDLQNKADTEAIEALQMFILETWWEQNANN